LGKKEKNLVEENVVGINLKSLHIFTLIA